MSNSFRSAVAKTILNNAINAEEWTPPINTAQIPAPLVNTASNEEEWKLLLPDDKSTNTEEIVKDEQDNEEIVLALIEPKRKSPRLKKHSISNEYASLMEISHESASSILNTNPDLRQQQKLDNIRDLGNVGIEMFKKAYIESASSPKHITIPPVTICPQCHKQDNTPINLPCYHRFHCIECTVWYRERNNDTCPVCNKPSHIEIIEDAKATKMTCMICYEDWETKYVMNVTDNCDHYLCIGCMTRSFKEVASNDASSFFKDGGIECPIPTCTHLTQESSFHQLVQLAKEGLPHEKTNQKPFTNEEIRKCKRFMVRSRIPVNQQIFCKNPNCPGKDAEDGELIAQDVGSGKGMFEFICNFCESEKYALCCKCKELWHPGIVDCEKAKEQDKKTMQLIQASSKPCPNCQVPTTRYHSHGCHHIKPGSGCAQCGYHWCYVCGGEYRKCGCEYQGATSCDSDAKGRVCTKNDIEFNEAGWPVSIFCGCPMCPDCRVGKKCEKCYGDCPVCKGIVPPGKLKHSDVLLKKITVNYEIYDKWEKEFDGKTKVNLGNKNLTDEDALAIGELLKTNNTLKELRLTNNNITDVQSIGEGLKTNNTLETLCLDHNNITDVESIGDGLKTNNTLTKLNLWHNNITDVQSIGDGLKTNNTLMELHLYNNNITDVQSIGEGLKTNNALTYLLLSNNNITDVQSIGDGLKTNNTLKELRLYNNNITNVQSIGEGLKTNNTLKTLDLGGNNITDVQSIGEGLKTNKTLTTLRLRYNNITDDSGIQSIIDVLKTNNTLKKLGISNNQLSDNMISQLEAIQQYKRDGSNGYQQVEGMWIWTEY